MLFKDDIYDTMMDNDEMWFVSDNGSAMLISDASLMDC